ncbi:tetratricopeptide repeat protein [Planomicrobium okeanokoites]|uniref:Tetratricopeptide repeat protein n=1 Tax=Planomicrobium okeanokoites TaxID=244 RepID=A0ABV7KQX9_PLAOK|nr:tetratricopeptide repeat protein [Planomicrobium okeanokoites]TAA70865.1 tetratricopeptide repeat protein [Planomicrobium okeanokoites]
MRKKYRELKRKGNVVVFPTTIERLLTEGMTLLKQERYEEARDGLYQVLTYEPEHPAALGAYSYCLYELGDYDEALEVCRELLKVGPIHYLETMELYISILMQVREFEEAERVIEALIDEKVLPEERLEQFHLLRDLNERIASKSIEKIDADQFTPEVFLKLNPYEQERKVMELPPSSFKPLKDKLIALVEHPEIDLLAKTYILFIMQQEKIIAKVNIHKFHYIGEFNISDLTDPQESPRVHDIKTIFAEQLAKDPTRLEMANELFERHVYLFYPFLMDEYDAKEVAEAYMSYLDLLFTGVADETSDEDLQNLLMQAEMWFEMRNR